MVRKSEADQNLSAEGFRDRGGLPIGEAVVTVIIPDWRGLRRRCDGRSSESGLAFVGDHSDIAAAVAVLSRESPRGVIVRLA
jgi:hypothetical protein